MKKIIVLVLAIITLLCLVSCNDSDTDNFDYPEYESAHADLGGFYDTTKSGVEVEIDMNKVMAEIGAYKYTDFARTDDVTDFVVIRVKNYGDIVLVLRPDVAPATVKNFKKLVSEDFYDGLIFHRVMEGFMIQGGGMRADGTEKDADTILGEFQANGFTNNLAHEAGVISMARTSVMNSASSQFFIMHAKNTGLDGNYAAFGYVLAGMDVVNKIATCSVDNPSSNSPKPIDDVVILETFFVKPSAETKLGTDKEYKTCEHTFGEWETTSEATCSREGVDQRKCSSCGKTEVKMLEKIDHKYPDVWTSVIEVSCSSVGKEQRECVMCENTETRSITKLPHTFEEGFCTICNAYSFEIDAETEGGIFDTSTTGTGAEVDMTKVTSQIDGYDYTDFVKSDVATDFVVIKVKDYGDIVLALRSDIAPITVENFKKLVSEDFYNGIVFHRVVKDFMIQGGYKTNDGSNKTADSIIGEFESNGHTNKLQHIFGVISMARASNKDSASSQFFIMQSDKPHLDGQYAGFGYVLAGLDVVDAIAKCDVDDPSASSPVPVENVVIEEIFFVSPIAGKGLAVAE